VYNSGNNLENGGGKAVAAALAMLTRLQTLNFKYSAPRRVVFLQHTCPIVAHATPMLDLEYLLDIWCCPSRPRVEHHRSSRATLARLQTRNLRHCTTALSCRSARARRFGGGGGGEGPSRRIFRSGMPIEQTEDFKTRGQDSIQPLANPGIGMRRTDPRAPQRVQHRGLYFYFLWNSQAVI
jgi:hypothetical protein